MGVMLKVWLWVKNNSKVALLVLVSLILFFLCASWYRKNKMIRKLKNDIDILQARIKLEKLAVKHDIMVDELYKLKDEESEIKAELVKIGDSLQNKLSADMTANEIVDSFKKIGLIG